MLLVLTWHMTNFHYLTYLTMDLSLKHCSIVDYNKLKKEK